MFKRMMLSVLVGGIRAPHWPAEVGLLVLRVVAGLSLSLVHGRMKLPPSDGFVQGVAQMGFAWPGFFAWSASLSEFVGGICLAIGLFTRPAAFFIACTMATAAFVAHAADPFAKKEPALLFLSIALLYMLVGAGRLSVDGLLRWKVLKVKSA